MDPVSHATDRHLRAQEASEEAEAAYEREYCNTVTQMAAVNAMVERIEEYEPLGIPADAARRLRWDLTSWIKREGAAVQAAIFASCDLAPSLAKFCEQYDEPPERDGDRERDEVMDR